METVKDVLRKRAMGYYVEETKVCGGKDGTSRAEKIKKHIPPDIEALMLYKRLYGEQLE